MTTKPDNSNHDENKHPYRFYWLTAGLATLLAAAIAATVTLSMSGSGASSNPAPGSSSPASGISKSSPATSPASAPADNGPAQAVSSAQLASDLLPAGSLGTGGSISGAGTDLSKIELICGGRLTGAEATAYETIIDNQTGEFLTETVTAWDSAANARAANAMNHQALDANGRCTSSNSGQTSTYTGDYAGTPPESCTSGQYLATAASLTTPSSITLYQGFLTGALCGTISVVVEVESDLPGVTQDIVDGYLSTAAQALQSGSPQ